MEEFNACFSWCALQKTLKLPACWFHFRVEVSIEEKKQTNSDESQRKVLSDVTNLKNFAEQRAVNYQEEGTASFAYGKARCFNFWSA